MSTNKKANRDKTINHNRQAIAGVRKHYASTPSIVLDGTPTTPNDVIATLQAAIDATDAAATAEKAFHDAVAVQHTAIAKGNALLRALKTLVKSQIGSAESTLGDFGFSTPKRQVPSEATKAAAVTKRKETRAARHTMGHRQKAKIKGEQPATAPTPTGTRPS